MPPIIISQLIDWTFPNLEHNYVNETWLAGRCILAPKNTVADNINMQCLQRPPGIACVCESADAIMDQDNQVGVPPEYLHTLTPSGLPPHTLHIKRGMPVMLLRNLRPSNGLCNGTRLIVLNVIERRVLRAKIMAGQFSGDVVLIPRIALQPKDGEYPFEWCRQQFRIRPCFAMTINKSQGQTLERARIFLADDVFAHGQLHVAASLTCLPP